MMNGMSYPDGRPSPIQRPASRLRLKAALLLVWAVVSFGGVFFARDLQFTVAGWPVNFWLAGQGAVLVYIAIVAFYAYVCNRQGHGGDAQALSSADAAHRLRLHKVFMVYVGWVLIFLLLMGLAERAGLSRSWMGAIFLLVSIGLYAVIGVHGRTADPGEYYVAGRQIPAVYNGMATAADWMSAASFISMAGGLYLQGFSGTDAEPGGLAYVLGWTGGFCLLALLVAPHLRRMNLYTVPDFFAVRFGGRWPRVIAACAAILCSFIYVVAQIYGVGLITSRLTGVQFEIGILLGLGGVLVCSFLGGMRAVTWTQVAQYVILILAFLIPVSWLAYKQLGNPLAPLVYGQQLPKITALEKQLAESPVERAVNKAYVQRAKVYEKKLQDVSGSLVRERTEAIDNLRRLQDDHADASVVFAARRTLTALPKDAAAARTHWSHAMADDLEHAKPLGGMPPHAQAFEGNPDGSPAERDLFHRSRLNFLALMFCLMVGTAGLPHLLTRSYTTVSVAETRSSVAWSLFFISLLYLAAPALAVLVKYEVLSNLVGHNMSTLPGWMAQWSKVDPSLLSVSDINGDGILHLSELTIGADLVMLATPELGGLPYVVSGLVAAGGLAAALSTADGLLLTIGNALSHDIYFAGKRAVDRVGAMQHVMLSKFALLLVALAAAYVAAQKPADILYLVSASFSMAAAAFVPVMVFGIYWRRTSRAGAVAGMLVGLGVSMYYMAINLPAVRHYLGLLGDGLWFGIQPISSGVFGVPAGALATWLVSLLGSRQHETETRTENVL